MQRSCEEKIYPQLDLCISSHVLWVCVAFIARKYCSAPLISHRHLINATPARYFLSLYKQSFRVLSLTGRSHLSLCFFLLCSCFLSCFQLELPIFISRVPSHHPSVILPSSLLSSIYPIAVTANHHHHLNQEIWITFSVYCLYWFLFSLLNLIYSISCIWVHYHLP